MHSIICISKNPRAALLSGTGVISRVCYPELIEESLGSLLRILVLVAAPAEVATLDVQVVDLGRAGAEELSEDQIREVNVLEIRPVAGDRHVADAGHVDDRAVGVGQITGVHRAAVAHARPLRVGPDGVVVHRHAVDAHRLVRLDRGRSERGDPARVGPGVRKGRGHVDGNAVVRVLGVAETEGVVARLELDRRRGGTDGLAVDDDRSRLARAANRRGDDEEAGEGRVRVTRVVRVGAGVARPAVLVAVVDVVAVVGAVAVPAGGVAADGGEESEEQRGEGHVGSCFLRWDVRGIPRAKWEKTSLASSRTTSHRTRTIADFGRFVNLSRKNNG